MENQIQMSAYLYYLTSRSILTPDTFMTWGIFDLYIYSIILSAPTFLYSVDYTYAHQSYSLLSINVLGILTFIM